MAGAVWLAVERFASAATEQPTDDAWNRLFAKGRAPPLEASSARLEQPAWARPALVMRALDATLVRRPGPAPAPGGPESDEPEAPGADEPAAGRVFGIDAGSPTPPRMPDTDPRLVLPETRLVMLRATLVAPLALAAGLAANRFGVLGVWRDPSERKDTFASVMDRLMGTNTQLLGAGSGDNNTNPPPDTPMRNTEERLRADPGALRAANAGVVFARFQAALVRLGPDELLPPAGAPVPGEPRRWALEHCRQFVAEKLFQEARAKSDSVQERVRAAAAFTKDLQAMGNAYELQRALMQSRLFDQTPLSEVVSATIGILQTYWTLARRSAEIAREAAVLVQTAARATLAGLDRSVFDAVLKDAPERLAKLDPLEPAVPRARLNEVSEAELALGLRRRRMLAEQKAAKEALMRVRTMIETALNAYDTKVATTVTAQVFTSVKPSRETLVSADERSGLAADRPWREAHTRTKFASTKEHVAQVLTPPAVRIRVALYRSVLEEHLARVYGLAPELPAERASPLKPPDEALFARGLRLYEAMVALRDMLLPTVGSAEHRAALVGVVDLLFAAHLDGAAEDASVREAWTRAWRGRLGSDQAATIVGGPGGLTEWLRRAEPIYNVNNPVNLGLSSDAITFTIEPRGDPYVGRTYADPATDWRYWVRKLRDARPPGAPLLWPADLPLPRAPAAPSRQEEEEEQREEAYGDPERTGPAALDRLNVYPVGDEGDENNGDIDISPLPADEPFTLVPVDAYLLLVQWEEHVNRTTNYDTPLWFLVRAAVVRAYVLRFHPLLRRRGPIVRARRALEDARARLDTIEDVLFSTKMRDVGQPEPRGKTNEDVAREVAALRSRLGTLLGSP